jgi:DNA-binding Xre family transcriptional regulator
MTNSYKTAFVEKIKRGQRDLKNGKGVKLTLKELEKICK